MARTRIIFDTEEELRIAIRLAATKLRTSPSKVINDILYRALAQELKDAKKYVPPPKDDDD